MGNRGRWKNAVEGKDLRVNVEKTKGVQLLFGKEIVFQNWILVVSVVSGLVVILFSVRNVRLVHRRSNVPRQVSSTIMLGYLFL